MRSLGLNLFVAFALVSFAYVHSDRRQVTEAYHAFIAAQASGVPYAICAQEFPDRLEERAEDLEECTADLTRYRANHPASTHTWRTLQDARVVDVEVEGDYATASLRVAGCTLPTVDHDFERAEDGRWYERTISDASFHEPVPPCEEGGEIPPPELAWTWQNREWR